MTKLTRAIIAGALAIGLAILAAWQVNERATSLDRVTDVASIDQLQEAFNRDAGSPRLILLLSPT